MVAYLVGGTVGIVLAVLCVSAWLVLRHAGTTYGVKPSWGLRALLFRVLSFGRLGLKGAAPPSTPNYGTSASVSNESFQKSWRDYCMRKSVAPIPETVPWVEPGNWPTLVAKGWRWARNIPSYTSGTRLSNDTIVAAYQKDYGVENVAIGFAWNQDEMGPVGVTNTSGLYVNDAEQQVSRLRRALAEYEVTGDFETE